MTTAERIQEDLKRARKWYTDDPSDEYYDMINALCQDIEILQEELSNAKHDRNVASRKLQALNKKTWGGKIKQEDK